jgi:8-amino-7-oxononanoate synthase
VTDLPALHWLAPAAADRLRAGVHRVLRPRAAGVAGLDLASNDYLGLARDPRVVAAASAAAQRWGTGSTGSRLVTGTTELHAELESALAAAVGAPAALVFSSGYLANVGAITALAGPDCLIVSDAANHASLIDGCRLARSRVAVVPQAGLHAADAALAGRAESRALIVVDAIDSTDGRLQPISDWHALARRHGALLVLDDAHGLGVRGGGRGWVAEAGLAAEPDVVTTVTLSKALGSQGGAVLGARAVIDHLIDTARPFIFDTGLAPAAAGAALTALAIMAAEPQRVARVLLRAEDLARAAGVPASGSAVIPVIIGDAQTALEVAAALRERDIVVGCFRPPSVPPGTARLRLTAGATLEEADIAAVAHALGEVLAEQRMEVHDG